MSYIGAIILSLAALMILLQLYAWYSAKKAVGTAAPQLDGTPLSDETQLVYFHSARCAACKPMTPVMQSLIDEGAPVTMIDAREQVEIARNYQVRGTPTLVLVKAGKIKDVAIGAKSEKQIRELLGHHSS